MREFLNSFASIQMDYAGGSGGADVSSINYGIAKQNMPSHWADCGHLQPKSRISRRASAGKDTRIAGKCHFMRFESAV
jgi:hypothetical protein